MNTSENMAETPSTIDPVDLFTPLADLRAFVRQFRRAAADPKAPAAARKFYGGIADHNQAMLDKRLQVDARNRAAASRRK